MKRIFDKIPNEVKLSGLASRPWLIVPVCSCLHLTYAVGLWLDDRVEKITALHMGQIMFGPFLWLALVIVAVLAVVPMMFRLKAKEIHLYLWPQQFMLCLMAASAAVAAYNGSYPDGYPGGHAFIFTDQSFTIWLMLGHLAAMVRNARFR